MSESSYCSTVIDNLIPGTALVMRLDFFRKAWPRRRAKAGLRSSLSHLNVEGNSNLTAALVRHSSLHSSFSHLFLQNKYSLCLHVAVAQAQHPGEQDHILLLSSPYLAVK
jgi:hypothetical protein